MKTMPGNLTYCAVKHFWGDTEHQVDVAFSEQGAHVQIKSLEGNKQEINLSPPQIAILHELLGNYSHY